MQTLQKSPLSVDWDTTSTRSVLCGVESDDQKPNSILRISVKEAADHFRSQIVERLSCEGSVEQFN